MKMIFGDEGDLEHVLDLIRSQDMEGLSNEPMPAARRLADLLREGLVADGVEAHQIADTSDIVNWFLVYECPQGSWHRAYAQCLATLMIYFLEPSGSLQSAGDRLARDVDLRRLEDHCGYVLMADRLRLATDEVTRQLERTWYWFEQVNDALIDVSNEIRSAPATAVAPDGNALVAERLLAIEGMLGSIKSITEKTAEGVAALRPKETGEQKAVRLLETLNREKAEYLARGKKFTATEFHRRWAAKEGCGTDNIKRLLSLGRQLESGAETRASSSTRGHARLANFKKSG